MNDRQLKSFIGKVVDESRSRTLTAIIVANEAYAHIDLPDEFNSMAYLEAMEILKPMAAEVLREKFENPQTRHPSTSRRYGNTESAVESLNHHNALSDTLSDFRRFQAGQGAVH